MVSYTTFLRTLGGPEDTLNFQTDITPPEAFRLARITFHAPDWNACHNFLLKNSCEDLDMMMILHIVFGIDRVPVTQLVLSQILAKCDGLITMDYFMTRVVCLNRNVRTAVVNLLLDQLGMNQEEHPKWSDTLLSSAIRNSCAGVVRCIARRYPKTLTMKNVIGLSPLHLSLSYGTDAASTKRILKILLQEEKRNGICGVLTTRMSDTSRGGKSLSAPIDLALFYVFKKYKPSVPVSYCLDEWECLSYCIKAAKNHDEFFDIAHYLISWRPTTRNFLTAVIQYFNLSLESKDKDGRTLIVASLLEYTQSKATNVRQLLHLGTNFDKPVQAYTDLSGKFVKNRYLLNVALDSPCTKWEILQSITEKNVNAIHQRDQVTGLYPFMQAACNKDQSLENIYQLIRMEPNIITLCANTDRQRVRVRASHLLYVLVNIMLVSGLAIWTMNTMISPSPMQEIQKMFMFNADGGMRLEFSDAQYGNILL